MKPGFSHTPAGGLRTPSGLIIGGAIERQKPEMSADAIKFQAAFCPVPRTTLREHLVELVYTAPGPLLLSIIIGGLVWGLARVIAS